MMGSSTSLMNILIVALMLIIVGIISLIWTRHQQKQRVRPTTPSVMAFLFILFHWLLDLLSSVLSFFWLQPSYLLPIGFLLSLFGLVAAFKERTNHWGFTLILGTVSLIRLLFLVYL